MRDHAKVSPRFWIGDTGREIRRLGRDAQVVALYLITNPHANMIGLYYMPIPTIAHETGIPLQGASKALRRVCETGFAHYDDKDELVFVPNMAKEQIAESIKPNDKRWTGVIRELESYRKHRFCKMFQDAYASSYSLPEAIPQSSPFEAPSKPLRSQEQEKEQEQEQEKEKEQENEQDSNSCSESSVPEASKPPDPNLVFVQFPLAGSISNPPPGFVQLTEIVRWRELYPGVDVEAEVRKWVGWCEANPTKRKTAAGWKKSVATWLGRCQDAGGAGGQRNAGTGQGSWGGNSRPSPEAAAERRNAREFVGGIPPIPQD